MLTYDSKTLVACDCSFGLSSVPSSFDCPCLDESATEVFGFTCDLSQPEELALMLSRKIGLVGGVHAIPSYCV